MTTISETPVALPSLNYEFDQPELLQLALTHKSYSNEQGLTGKSPMDNERLEFLGDAVLDLALSECLMKRFPSDPEGSLSKKRASLVNEEMLSKIALELGLNDHLRLGKGEAKSGGLQKPRILASALEAVLGAVFSDGSYPAALSVVEKLFESRLVMLETSDVDFQSDFKTRLQERVQEIHKLTPVYKVEAETGPDHDKLFEVSVRVGESTLAVGQGRSKKAAEQDAARMALETYGPEKQEEKKQ